MLARSITFTLSDGQSVSTPLLLPSFSSKGFPDLKRVVSGLSEYISGPVLFSAYDVCHDKIATKLPLSPEVLFIDSGGYECSNITDVVEFDKGERKRDKSGKKESWNHDYYLEIIKKIIDKNNLSSKVIISYDSPKKRWNLDEQISRAINDFEVFERKDPNIAKELLIKPEIYDKDPTYIPVDKIIKNIQKLKSFDIIGFTEKELGSTLIKAMINLSKIRRALKQKGMNQLIHIFGSLDPISSPLYFLCGADIFDGVTWLRYAFFKGLTIYQQNYWFKQCPWDTATFALRMRSAIDNLRYLSVLKFEMKRFSKSKNFLVFEHNSELFEKMWKTVKSHIGGS